MLLRLRHAFPILQKFHGWTATSTPALPLIRHLARAAAAASPEDIPEVTDSPPSSFSLEATRPRRSTRSAKPKAEAAVPVEVEAAAEAPADAGSSTPVAAPKRRASTRRKAADSSEPGSDLGAVPAPNNGSNLAATGTVSAEAAPPKRGRKKKQSAEAVALDAQTAVSSAAPPNATPEDIGGAASSTAKKKRSSGTRPRKATAAAAELVEDLPAEEPAVPNVVLSLPYEETLVLPRKAESLLQALGIRTPPATAPKPLAEPLRNVMEVARYMQYKRLKDAALPLLLAQYQGYLGNSPDYLYDLFCLDMGPEFLKCEDVKLSVVAAARAAKQLLSASTGAPTEPLAKSALEQLTSRVGEDTVLVQERRAGSLTEAQLELFLLDWASANLAGPRDWDDNSYIARRCAALQLVSKVVLDRLYSYTVGGTRLEDLTQTGSKSVKLGRVLEALLEGLKVGVRMDRQRLLEDFRLGPGSAIHDHLPYLVQEVKKAAEIASDPGGMSFYEPLRGSLMRNNPELRNAIEEQEKQWQSDTGDKDGKALTNNQLRLLFHLGRLDRFREEQQGRKQQEQGQGQGQ